MILPTTWPKSSISSAMRSSSFSEQITMRTLALFLLLLLMLLKFDVVVAEPEQKTIVIGGSVVGLREFNQQDMQIGLRSAMNDQLAEKGINIEVNIYATSQELYSAVKEGKVKLIFGTPMEFFS